MIKLCNKMLLIIILKAIILNFLINIINTFVTYKNSKIYLLMINNKLMKKIKSQKNLIKILLNLKINISKIIIKFN